MKSQSGNALLYTLIVIAMLSEGLLRVFTLLHQSAENISASIPSLKDAELQRAELLIHAIESNQTECSKKEHSEVCTLQNIPLIDSSLLFQDSNPTCTVIDSLLPSRVTPTDIVASYTCHNPTTTNPIIQFKGNIIFEDDIVFPTSVRLIAARGRITSKKTLTITGKTILIAPGSIELDTVSVTPTGELFIASAQKIEIKNKIQGSQITKILLHDPSINETVLKILPITKGAPIIWGLYK